MSIKIALCDTDCAFLSALHDRVGAFFADNDIPHSIWEYHSSETLLSENRSFDLVLLDSVFHKMKGIDVADLLRRKKSRADIIFISAHLQHAPLGYMVNALRYVLKHEINSMLDEALRAFLTKHERSNRTITVTIAGNPVTIILRKILYVESKAPKVRFYLTDGVLDSFKSTLDAVEEMLPKFGFLRIHKSYLVNLSHVNQMNNYWCYLGDGNKLPIAQKKHKDAKKKYIIYRGKL